MSKYAVVVAKKELLEIFRDRYILIIMIVPILIFPIFNIGMDYLNKDAETRVDVSIQSDNPRANQLFEEFFRNNNKYEIKQIGQDEPIELLNRGVLNCVININNNAIDFIYNSSSYNSLALTTKLEEEFEIFYHGILCGSYPDIYVLNLKNESNGMSNAADSMSNIIVPIILIMLVFQGMTAFSNNIFAGEKERRTLELVMLSGVERKYIYLGKVVALLILKVINLILTISSYFISFGLSGEKMHQFKFMRNGNPGLNILVMITILFLMSILSVVISMTVSIVSKDTKNAQILNEIVLAVPVGLIAASMLGIIRRNNILINIIPIFNMVECFNSAFAGSVDCLLIVASVIMNCIVILGLRFLYKGIIINHNKNRANLH